MDVQRYISEPGIEREKGTPAKRTVCGVTVFSFGPRLKGLLCTAALPDRLDNRSGWRRLRCCSVDLSSQGFPESFLACF
jgi:hypothetical protein